MKAAVIAEHGAAPEYADFAEPEARDGCVRIAVETAGLGGWDVLGAYRLAMQYPCVLRGEGVGRAEDGRRVYFGERSVAPWGGWAEHTIVPAAEVWDVPDDVDDATAITMAIAGTGALIPLESAAIKPGEKVLILGATGVIGQLMLQMARVMGAGEIVGASRSESALAELTTKGLADTTVCLTGGDSDPAALKQAGGDGFDVVMDLVCGAPMVAALRATRWGARIVTVGTGAGAGINITAGDLLFRTLTTIGTGQRPPSDREAIWRRLLAMNAAHDFKIDYKRYDLPQIAQAWAAQKAGPHAKIVGAVRA
ncbi:zinc-binding alcohol dehydrogenase family protein [Sphingomonas sp. BAUL-RG-20F-R05-02]|uniref:quinone oxidoreductase family protein n=1 Tax=Sphingomonas sp. BAUL-RG-20F-R05-02 TaxID=2914830 RepID=UPI001F5950FA|nr:zinc-binding alcohol dehydrogenase family protein [Sphingomonas sp. BAUL-RG-20F-R05-02]